MTVSLASGSIYLESPVYCGSKWGMLQYDDGSSHWLTWKGVYRGVWFVTDDFLPGSWFNADYSEYWFYHHSEYPWDTSDFYAELWTDDSCSPGMLIDRDIVVASHNTAILSDHDPDYWFEQCWSIVNTELSEGGWPSLLGDNTPNTADHSFYSDDFEVWLPWIKTGSIASDYFIMLWAGFGSLEAETWGGIKGLYRL